MKPGYKGSGYKGPGYKSGGHNERQGYNECRLQWPQEGSGVGTQRGSSGKWALSCM